MRKGWGYLRISFLFPSRFLIPYDARGGYGSPVRSARRQAALKRRWCGYGISFFIPSFLPSLHNPRLTVVRIIYAQLPRFGDGDRFQGLDLSHSLWWREEPLFLDKEIRPKNIFITHSMYINNFRSYIRNFLHIYFSISNMLTYCFF